MIESEELSLLYSIAKSEGLNKGYKTPLYHPIYKHPLPVSEHRYDHENHLRRILSCKIPFQGMAAITKGDAWSLEEVYMRNGKDCLADRDGVPPLHVSVQLNQLECVQVLLNIGVDINEANQYGYTPLRVAKVNGLKDIVDLLIQFEAKEFAEVTDEAPSTTVLEVYPEQNFGKMKKEIYQKRNVNQVSKSSRYF